MTIKSILMSRYIYFLLELHPIENDHICALWNNRFLKYLET